MIDYKKTIEDLRNADNLTADHKLLGVCERAADAIEALQGEVQFYKNLAEEWRETADSKQRLLGMYRAQNIYSAKDSSGPLITNLCSLNRSESPNSPENPDS